MRVRIENTKEMLVSVIASYLSSLLVEHKVELIINGEKLVGVVTNIELVQGEIDKLAITINEETRFAPLTNHTKLDIGVELVSFITNSHTTIIEFL